MVEGTPSTFCELATTFLFKDNQSTMCHNHKCMAFLFMKHSPSNFGRLKVHHIPHRFHSTLHSLKLNSENLHPRPVQGCYELISRSYSRSFWPFLSITMAAGRMAFLYSSLWTAGLGTIFLSSLSDEANTPTAIRCSKCLNRQEM